MFILVGDVIQCSTICAHPPRTIFLGSKMIGITHRLMLSYTHPSFINALTWVWISFVSWGLL